MSDIIENIIDNTKNYLIGEYGELDESQIDTSMWANYDFTNNKSNLKSNFANTLRYVQYKTINIVNYANNQDISVDTMRGQWVDFGRNYLKNWTQIGDIWNANDNTSFFEKLGNTLLTGLLNIPTTLTTITSGIGLGASQGLNMVAKYANTTSIEVEDWINENIAKASVETAEQLSSLLNNYAENLGGDSVFMSVINKGITIFSDGALTVYKNGVDETSFGRLMESSWSKSGSNGFLSLIDKQVYFAESTPFDSGSTMSNLYGKMLLGTPPLFTNVTDPKNRAMAETFVRDAKFLTLTPGFPQYNGSNMLLRVNQDQYHQTTDAKSMLNYLLKNGLDSDSFNKDKRYYTFKTNYEEYYTYLETMLNTMWIKMGLATTDKNKYSIYTFFEDPVANGENSKLKSQYQSSFGFFVNPAGSVTESISNESSHYGSTYANQVNEASETYQQINYLTGMGTGSTIRNKEALAAKAMGLTSNIKAFISDVASNTVNAFLHGSGNLLARALQVAGGIGTDTRKFLTETDKGAELQSFATTNGMKVVYPELWQDSTFSKTISLNFEFISPYGDPLSIFQYVIAPFCALLTYAMPRQAADNGFVSPFFVRADIPGLFTSDLAMISEISWSRGGSGDLWTKDGLPRAISGSFSIQDLYPYLSMTKRLSFLSANPNYTTFLDNLAGLHAVNTNESEDALNDYWKAMLNRVNGGAAIANGLYNRYSSNNRITNAQYADSSSSSRLGGSTKKRSSSPWLRGIS